MMSELRQLEDKLGLSPKARRDLRWRLVDDGGEVVEENGERVSAADRVRRLRVVGGQAG